MKKLLLAFILALAGFNLYYSGHEQPQSTNHQIQTLSRAENSDARIADAYANHQSNLQIKGNGTVLKILPDDNYGSRHQKFIVKLDSGHSLLIAHNIDIAPKITALKRGDRIEFNGEYEWNRRGGIIHWTHHDPDASHVPGWLLHNGRKYQ